MFLLPSPLCPNSLFVLLQWCAGTYLLETWTSTKDLLSMGDYLRQCFPGPRRPWLGGAGASSWATQGPQLGPRSAYLLPNTWVGETSPGFLGVWCWIPQLPQRHFCPWMDTKLLLLGRGGWTGTRDVLFSYDADITLNLIFISCILIVT